jgi:SAM-dependent methyltransferase
MLIRGDILLLPCTLALITLVAVSLGATSVGAQGGIFSAGDAYERFMGRWSRELAPLLVTFAGVRNGDAVLDVGSGTGALTAAVAAVTPSSRVIGIDPAAPYVAFAQARRTEDLVRFEVGDAQQLRFLDGRFDWTLSLLVFNFIPDPAKALAEMIRVTRPGGTVAAAVWDYEQEMEMLRVFWDEAVALSPAADTRDERHMPLCRKGELGALWREHRLRDVSEEALTIRTRFSSFDDYWSPFLEKQGPAGAYVAALAASEREQLRLRLAPPRRRPRSSDRARCSCVGCAGHRAFTRAFRTMSVSARSGQLVVYLRPNHLR